MNDGKKDGVVHGEVLPPESRTGLQMPDGTPLGLGFLGAMRFDAIRRVLDYYERALRSAVAVRDAEAEHFNAIARRTVSHEQLTNLDVIRAVERKRIQTEAERIEDEAKIAALKRTVEQLDLEAKVIEKQGQLERTKAKYGEGGQPAAAKDEYAELLDELRRLPDIAAAMVSVKADIIKKFGGEDKLGEEGQQLIDSLNALINATIQKRAEGRVL